MSIDSHQMEKVIFFGKGVQRFTQDSPIMPDVWVEYGRKPLARIDLLLNSYKEVPPGKVCRVLLKRLQNFSAVLPRDGAKKGTEIAYNQSTVAARLYFDELIQIVLPMTSWWNRNIRGDRLDRFTRFISDPNVAREVVKHLKEYPVAKQDEEDDSDPPMTPVDEATLPVTSSLLWLIRVAGAIAAEAQRTADARAWRDHPSGGPSQREQRPLDLNEDAEEIVEAARRLLGGRREVEDEHLTQSSPISLHEQRSLVWSVNRNRPAGSMVWLSVPAVKADAAARLFDLNCSRLSWAIVDTGVDARHPAFQRRTPKHSPAPQRPGDKGSVVASSADEQSPAPGDSRGAGSAERPAWRETTRVMATYDFTKIRYILSPDPSSFDRLHPALKQYFQAHPEKRNEVMDRLKAGRFIDWDFFLPYLEISHFEKERQEPTRSTADLPPGAAELAAADSASAPAAERTEQTGEGPASQTTEQRPEPPDAPRTREPSPPPFKRFYEPPLYSHGTHVAGILAADWPKDVDGNDSGYDINGMCPDIRLYDLRVLDEKGTGDEFSIIAALQFIRFLNANTESKAIHGVNMSLAIRHKVRNYACGCTPVCEEGERLVNTGVVVVAAAGNDGYLSYLQPGNVDSEGYRSISITDPGNSEAVITVGSTHRDRAHTYGVSFFSSRGPTGDGRLKPDLVAPGEKIVSTTPNGEWDTMDGTSMAAPHVSGAAALLMARYEELIGRPVRIKQILCATATDLGRERYFQGHGMVDILRAMQSI